MSIGKELTNALRRAGGAGAVELEAGPLRARATVADLDRYSAALTGLTVGFTPGAGAEPVSLERCAGALAASLSFLEEPLALIEADRPSGEGIIRSAPPQADEGAVTYWELRLRLGAASEAELARYSWAPGMLERERVPYPATFALLGRITDAVADGLSH